jgi:hypothetical protein
MYISCSSLWDAGITKDKVSCCGSCHDDAELFPGQYDLMEIYPDEIGLPRSDHTIGSICCAVWHFLDKVEERKEILRTIYDKFGCYRRNA